jgi:uncharacterized protein YukE
METPKQKAEYQPSEEDLKAIKESIEEHNKGVRENKKNTSEIFSNDSNKKDFESLNNNTQEFLANIYDNVAIGFIDRIRVAKSNKLYSYHKEKNENLENDIIIKKRTIKQIENDIKTHEVRIEKLRQQFGELPKKAEKEATAEKKKFRNALRDANYEENELIEKQLSNEKKLKKYEEKRNKIIERIEKFVNEKIEPHKEKIGKLNENVRMLDGEIKLFTSKKDNVKNRLDKLQKEADDLQRSKVGMFESEKITYTEKMKEVHTEFSKMGDIIKSRKKEKDNINIEIGELENKIDYWNNVLEKAKTDNMPREEQSASDSKEKIVPEEEVKEAENFKPSTEKDESKTAEKQDNVGNNTEEKFDEHPSRDENKPEENLDNKEIHPKKYISRWNGLSKMGYVTGMPKLDKKEIFNILDIKNSKTLRLKVMEEAITEYNKSFSKVSEGKLKEMFESMRKYEQQ